MDRDRDDTGRARNARPRDGLGRPLPYGAAGIPTMPDDLVVEPQQALAEAQRLLDAGRPFHAHEVLEAAWKSAPEPERELWRGLAQLAVGLTHARRGNATGAMRLLSRAGARIAGYAPAPSRAAAGNAAAPSHVAAGNAAAGNAAAPSHVAAGAAAAAPFRADAGGASPPAFSDGATDGGTQDGATDGGSPDGAADGGSQDNAAGGTQSATGAGPALYGIDVSGLTAWVAATVARIDAAGLDALSPADLAPRLRGMDAGQGA